MDDIVIYSNTFNEHLEEVFERLWKHGIHLKPSKCQITMRTVEILGHKISAGEVKPVKKNLKIICDLEPPKTKTGLRSFLGLCSFYREFIKTLPISWSHYTC